MHVSVNDHPSRRRRPHRRLVAPTTALLALTLGLAACGDDAEDDDAAGVPTTTAGEETTSTAADGVAVASFCDALLDVDAAFNQGPDVDETATEEEIQAALQEFSATVEPLVQEVQTAAPAEIQEDVDLVAELIREGLSTGDESIFESDDFEAADTNIDEFALEECPFETVEITGVDYAFEGVPASVGTGQLALDFTVAEGGEPHEMVVVRINDDVEAPIEEIAAQPFEQVAQQVQFLGRAFGLPGESDPLFLSVEEPGRYGLVCFLPVGSTAESLEEMEGPPAEDAPTHFSQGMFAEFTVE